MKRWAVINPEFPKERLRYFTKAQAAWHLVCMEQLGELVGFDYELKKLPWFA